MRRSLCPRSDGASAPGHPDPSSGFRGVALPAPPSQVARLLRVHAPSSLPLSEALSIRPAGPSFFTPPNGGSSKTRALSPRIPNPFSEATGAFCFRPSWRNAYRPLFRRSFKPESEKTPRRCRVIKGKADVAVEIKIVREVVPRHHVGIHGTDILSIKAGHHMLRALQR
jgi:hypothetical protein